MAMVAKPPRAYGPGCGGMLFERQVPTVDLRGG